MAQPKRKTESRRAARRQAGRRVPVSNVAGRLVIMLALVAAVVFVLLFCVLGFDLFSEPGSLRELSFGTPLGREYRFPLPFD